MKLVINTQHSENYGAHDWDGKGQCPQYWKFKGGAVYVVENLTPNQVLKMTEHGINTLTALIQRSSEYFRETIIGWSFEDNDVVVCEPYETPVMLSWENNRNRWVACETIVNNEYNFLNQRVAKIEKKWDMLMGGDHENYNVVYTMSNGDTVVETIFQEYMKGA
jgi:hypothetical protein